MLSDSAGSEVSIRRRRKRRSARFRVVVVLFRTREILAKNFLRECHSNLGSETKDRRNRTRNDRKILSFHGSEDDREPYNNCASKSFCRIRGSDSGSLILIGVDSAMEFLRSCCSVCSPKTRPFVNGPLGDEIVLISNTRTRIGCCFFVDRRLEQWIYRGVPWSPVSPDRMVPTSQSCC